MNAQEFNPNSLDATLARIIATQEANHTATMARFDRQDNELKAIKQQAQLTNGRVNGLEGRERDRKVRMATYATAFTVVGSGVGFVLDLVVKAVFHIS